MTRSTLHRLNRRPVGATIEPRTTSIRKKPGGRCADWILGQLSCSNAAWAAANLATGTLKGEQLT